MTSFRGPEPGHLPVLRPDRGSRPEAGGRAPARRSRGWIGPGPAAALLLALVLPLPAGAQWVEAVELGTLGRWAFYDEDVGLDDTGGWGVRVGVHLGERWIAEGDWSFQNPRESATITFGSTVYPGARVSHDLIGGRLVHHRPLGDRLRLLAGAGVQYDRYKGERGWGASGTGIGVLAGLRARLTRVFSLRIEGTAYRVGSDPDRAIPRPTTLNLGLQAGIAYTFRGAGRIVELPPPPPDTVIVEPRSPDSTGSVHIQGRGTTGSPSLRALRTFRLCGWTPVTGGEPCPWLPGDQPW